MSDTRRWVEAVLYGTGSLQRFTQHSPVLGDVWVGYFEAPKKPLDLLVTPWREEPPYEVAQVLLRSLDPDAGEDAPVAADITANRITVAAALTLKELIVHLVPLSDWYRGLASTNTGARKERARAEEYPFDPRLPRPDQLWSDVFTECEGGYAYPRVLSMLRVAGLIAHVGLHGVRNVANDLDRLLQGDRAGDAAAARTRLAKKMLAAFRKVIGPALPRPYPKKSLVYAINRNRPAMLALRNSVRTVKADAARTLFDIDCSKLTWAIIDSGIDARHPAFRNRKAPAGAGLDKSSRVTRTLDFSYLREILLRNLDDLPPRIRKLAERRKGESKDAFDKRTEDWKEIVRRVRIGRAVDWQLLEPFIEIPHDDYHPPADPHGTHVAGILAADWEEEKLKGICPDIKLIDIRVIRENGTSDEFVIMSALQYLRYLNANTDFMAVNGVNMSLSLIHDAANYACGQTPVCEEAARTVDSGMVVVAAAGNLGFRRMLGAKDVPFDQYLPVSITDPGNADDVITVGSTHRMEPHTYGVSYFSSRGPTGDGRIKPDLVAPGEKIYGPAPDDGDVTLDGTSMAAPHVSGAAALLMARHVELNGRPRRIKQILCSTATDLGRERYFQGHGLVDVLRAIQSV
jgi:hypothetical protein